MKLLIGETSAIYRSIMKEIVSYNENFSLCSFAENEKDFYNKVNSLHPDCISIDVNIFENKTIEHILYELEKIKLPTILFINETQSSVHFKKNIKTVLKPKFESFSSQKLKECALNFENTFKTLNNQIYSLKNQSKSMTLYEIPNKNDIFSDSKKISFSDYEALCIGVSTGGPSTILELLNGIGSNFPLPIFITQHIDETFDKSLIDWLQKNVSLPIHLAQDNEIPKKGHAYFAPAEVHLTFKRNNNDVLIKLNHDDVVNFLRPAVDKMFDSAAQIFGSKCIAVLLTGMGNDGAEGCCKIKKAGGFTIAQDEKSCIVFGMPKAAIDSGGISEILPLNKIADCLKKLIC